MAIIDSYRKSSFLQNEQGSHLDQWRTESYWKSVQSASGAQQAPRIWSHYVLEPPERALDYLDWLNHRHPRLPYLLRRLLLPAWLLTPILREIANQQIARITQVDSGHRFEIKPYAVKAYVWKHELQRCLKRSPASLPLMRAIRLLSEWTRAREKLIQASIEKQKLDAGAVPEPIEVRATPWQRPGVGTWNAKQVLNELLAAQEKADNELFIAVSDFSNTPLDESTLRQAALPQLKLNPRKSRTHYIFQSEEHAIEQLHRLNHQRPKLPYVARRLLLPTLLLTRFVEAIAQHQRSRCAAAPHASKRHAQAYFAAAQKRSQSLAACIEQRPIQIPLMKAFRLNCEWLRERNALLQERPITDTRSLTKIEIKATPWLAENNQKLNTQDTLRKLLALQCKIDEELSSVLLTPEP